MHRTMIVCISAVTTATMNVLRYHFGKSDLKRFMCLQKYYVEGVTGGAVKG